MGETNLYAYNFQDFSKFLQQKNFPISATLDNNTPSFWDLIFRLNLTNVEIEDLERLKSLLSQIHMTPPAPRCKSLHTMFSRVFSIKLFLSASSISSYFVSFYLAKFW